MLKEKAGETAGKIWSALNETEGILQEDGSWKQERLAP